MGHTEEKWWQIDGEGSESTSRPCPLLYWFRPAPQDVEPAPGLHLNHGSLQLGAQRGQRELLTRGADFLYVEVVVLHSQCQPSVYATQGMRAHTL